MKRHALTLFAWLTALSACSPPPDVRQTNFEVRGKSAIAKFDPQTGRLKRVDIDQDKNGRMDSFSYWDATRIIRIELDRDEDGKIERWEYYDVKNRIERIGSSSRDDAVQDTWTYPDERGFLGRVEADTDRDGTIDKREIFTPRPDAPDGRVLSVVEFGIDKTGIPAQRLYYRPNGELDRAETPRR